MKTKFFHSLEDAIQNWIESVCGDDEIPPYFWADNIATLMTKAAMAVLDAQFSGQQKIEQEKDIS